MEVSKVQSDIQVKTQLLVSIANEIGTEELVGEVGKFYRLQRVAE